MGGRGDLGGGYVSGWVRVCSRLGRRFDTLGKRVGWEARDSVARTKGEAIGIRRMKAVAYTGKLSMGRVDALLLLLRMLS